MATHALDPYRSRPSLIHGLDPRIKTVFVLTYVLTVALLPYRAWPLYILYLSLSIAVGLLSELGIGYLMTRSLLALPFILAVLPLMVTVPGIPLATLALGRWMLVVSREGVARFASIAMKSWLSIQMAVVLTGSTPFPALLVALQALGVPKLLVSIVGLAWRYGFVFSDEAARMLRARASRSGTTDAARRVGGNVWWRARVTGSMAGSLFLRGMARAERIYAAMLARGYDGGIRSLTVPPLSRTQWLILCASLCPLVGTVLLGIVLWA